MLYCPNIISLKDLLPFIYLSMFHNIDIIILVKEKFEHKMKSIATVQFVKTRLCKYLKNLKLHIKAEDTVTEVRSIAFRKMRLENNHSSIFFYFIFFEL